MRSSNAGSKNTFTGKERLGVRIELLTVENRLDYHGQKAGILVAGVAENSVAQEIGLQEYDIILAVNNKIVDKPSILLEEVRDARRENTDYIF